MAFHEISRFKGFQNSLKMMSSLSKFTCNVNLTPVNKDSFVIQNKYFVTSSVHLRKYKNESNLS